MSDDKKRSGEEAQLNGGGPAKKKGKGVGEFEAAFAPLVADIVADLKANETLPAGAIDHVELLCNTTVPGGKMNRGLTVVHALETLKGAPLSEEDAADARVLGWCVEWLQAFFLVADDLMDDSETRRGKPCWYRRPEIGLMAVNDSLLLETLMYEIIRRRFRQRSYYADILDLFHKITYKTELGQLLDLTSERKAKGNDLSNTGDNLDFSTFTEETHRGIVVYKTAFYTFYLPIACALFLAGETRDAVLKEAEDICKVMGEYFQVQDDVLDAFAPPEVLGKIGTDIQDFKCSWLAFKCLERCTPDQRKVFEANYGRKGDDNVETVKNLYRELKLQELFDEYEEESYKRINAMIEKVTDVNKQIYTDLLAKVYKRKH